MFLWFVRIFFVAGFYFVGYQLGVGMEFLQPNLFGIIGVILALCVILMETLTGKISMRGLSSAVFGLLLGLIMAKILIEPFKLLSLPKESIEALNVIFTVLFVYLCVTLAFRGRDEFNIVIPYVKFKRQDLAEEGFLLDSSVIIDGRFKDIIKTGFLEGRLIIPRFILHELQKIADSQDPLKRQRGRRGLEILNSMRDTPGIDVKIDEQDVEGNDADSKLVRLAQMLDVKVLTTDYNLNRLAELQGVRVLNINELANALKPEFLPGERITLKLIREGKEYNQAVGYLDDGTMVVVENARNLIGKTVDIVVTSVLQTPAGKIVFTKLSNA